MALQGARPLFRREAASGLAVEKERRRGGARPRRDADGTKRDAGAKLERRVTEAAQREGWDGAGP